jgi:hypothetical protein
LSPVRRLLVLTAVLLATLGAAGASSAAAMPHVRVVNDSHQPAHVSFVVDGETHIAVDHPSSTRIVIADPGSCVRIWRIHERLGDAECHRYGDFKAHVQGFHADFSHESHHHAFVIRLRF